MFPNKIYPMIYRFGTFVIAFFGYSPCNTLHILSVHFIGVSNTLLIKFLLVAIDVNLLICISVSICKIFISILILVN